MITLNSKLELTKRVNKTDLNQLAASRYGDGVYCEHVRSGKRGWYLNKDTEQTFLGVNASEAFSCLQSQEDVTKMSAPATFVVSDTMTMKSSVSKPKAVIETVVSNAIEPASTIEPNQERASISPEGLLEILLGKFPNTFFREPAKIRPVQRYIHKKLRQALNNEYTKDEISAALVLYTQTVDYCKKIVEGEQRVDLEGNPCEEVSPHHIKDAKARLSGDNSMRPAKKRQPIIPPIPLPPPQLEQLVCGNMELCVKINELPADSRTLKNGWEEFIIDANKQKVKIKVRPKTWKKLQKAAREYPAWVANVRGQMGNRVKGGFELLKPGVQIFEKKVVV